MVMTNASPPLFLFFAAALLFPALAAAALQPYDETADAKAQIQAALSEAWKDLSARDKNTLIRLYSER